MSAVAITCRDCGEPVEREATVVRCGCRVGFVAQWDSCIPGPVYLGRVIDPIEQKEVPK